MLPAILLLAGVLAPSTTAWGVSPVPDRELATMRGGILLPNGLNIAIGIDIQTRINGVLSLHTIYSSDTQNKAIQVYTDGTNSPSTAPGSTVVTTGGTLNASVDASRSPAGTTVIPATSSQPTTINVVSGPTSTWLNGAGQNNVPVVANGPAIAATSGTISLTEDAQGARGHAIDANDRGAAPCWAGDRGSYFEHRERSDDRHGKFDQRQSCRHTGRAAWQRTNDQPDRGGRGQPTLIAVNISLGATT